MTVLAYHDGPATDGDVRMLRRLANAIVDAPAGADSAPPR